MADVIKYVSLENLNLYDTKIKDHLAAADTVVKEALEGQIDIVAKAITDEAARAKLAEEAAAGAAAAAQAAADAAQGEVDALETYVGTIPADATATSIVGYVQEKTTGIATQTAMDELAGRVTDVEGDVATIKGDYLKAADKTELEGKITVVQTAVDTEKSRAEGIESGLDTRLKAVEDDYLKAADKTALQGGIDGVSGRVATIEGDYLKGSDKTALQNAIDAKVVKVDYDAKMLEIDTTTDSLQTQINTIMSNPDAEGAINSINEFTQYVTDHGAIADGFRTDINKSKDDIAAMDTAYKAADTALSGRLDTLEAIDHDAYKGADATLKSELNAEIAKKADQTALESAVSTLEGADTTLGNRISALEGKFEGDGSVSALIAAAKQEAIDAAASAADTKDEAVLAAAKKYADDEDAKVEQQVSALSAVVDTKAAQSDLTALDGRVTTAEGKVSTLEGKMTAVEALAAANKAAHEANAAAIALLASQADLEAVSGRVTTLETWHSNFKECTQEDISGLF